MMNRRGGEERCDQEFPYGLRCSRSAGHGGWHRAFADPPIEVDGVRITEAGGWTDLPESNYLLIEPGPTHDAVHAIRQMNAEPQGEASEPLYPYDNCDTMRTKAEGGTTFALCEECMAKHIAEREAMERLRAPSEAVPVAGSLMMPVQVAQHTINGWLQWLGSTGEDYGPLEWENLRQRIVDALALYAAPQPASESLSDALALRVEPK